MLTLDIEWLTGVAFLAANPADPEPAWPPQPDRAFSALVASWGARGELPAERAALEWLERQDPPSLAAATARPRTTVTSYVPPNDDASNLRALPERRRRQPRQFPAVRLPEPLEERPHLRLAWKEARPDPAIFDGLCALAQTTSYLGHSTALIRCRFDHGEPQEKGESQDGILKEYITKRAPYPGRLAELKALHERHINGDGRARPAPPTDTRANLAARSSAAQSVFAETWTILADAGLADAGLADAGGTSPNLLDTAIITRRLRDALMGAWPSQPPPEWLSGHTVDGSPSTAPHLAIVPLAFAGFEHADGSLKGLALLPPRELQNHWDSTPTLWHEKQALLAALAKLTQTNEDDISAIELKLGRAGEWRLTRDYARNLKSLDPARYIAPPGRSGAQRFATVTPIALDRHPKGEGPARLVEAAEIIKASCLRIGLPAPKKVVASKYSAIRGTLPAWPPGGAPPWQNWARPKSLAGRPLVHAVIEFSDHIRGPVILGAGRFFGLGLCLPLGSTAQDGAA